MGVVRMFVMRIADSDEWMKKYLPPEHKVIATKTGSFPWSMHWLIEGPFFPDTDVLKDVCFHMFEDENLTWRYVGEPLSDSTPRWKVQNV